MSTRSLVGIMNPDNTCTAIYVHFDGYLDGVGADLQQFKNEDAVRELISHGDRSSLTGPYYKDRGETGVEPQDYANFDEFYDAVQGCGAEYYYIFKDGVWYCGDAYDRWSEPTQITKKLVPYAEAVKSV